MKTGIKIFKSERFGEIRTAGTVEEPLFCLADVCRVLELQVTPTKNRLRKDGVSLIKVIDTLGREQEAIFISEQNLYKVIMRSDKPQAEPFQDWVCGEVLPSIRRTGGYIASKEDDTPEEIMARALIIAQDTMQRQRERITRLQAENKEQAGRIAAAAPKVAFANAIVASKSSCLIGELAKILTQNGYTIGQNRLFDWMRKNGYLGTVGERYNVPNQHWVEKGFFEIKKGVRSGSDGVMHTTITTKVTGAGQEYFINKFLAR